jgi:hypothetical protein
LGNHELLIFSRDALAVALLIVIMEEAAELILDANTLGGAKPFPADALERERRHMQHFGSQRSLKLRSGLLAPTFCSDALSITLGQHKRCSICGHSLWAGLVTAAAMAGVSERVIASYQMAPTLRLASDGLLSCVSNTSAYGKSHW